MCKIMDMVWYVAMVFILLKVHVLLCLEILNFSLIVFIDGMYVVALAPPIITFSGSTFHSLLVIFFISD